MQTANQTRKLAKDNQGLLESQASLTIFAANLTRRTILTLESLPAIYVDIGLTMQWAIFRESVW